MVLFETARTMWHLGRGAALKPPALGRDWVWLTRTNPLDLDLLGHVNNSKYATLAELARWRLTAPSGILQASIKNKWSFVVSEQAIAYKRSILPSTRFEIRTRVHTEPGENKWVYFDHDFVSPGAADAEYRFDGDGPPLPLPGGDDRTLYCTVRAKCVLKQGRKTIYHDELRQHSPYIDGAMAFAEEQRQLRSAAAAAVGVAPAGDEPLGAASKLWP
jgi:hypothetical protein